MAKQHTFFGKGAPDITPSALNQHYIDLYNRKIYLSRGKASPADWGPPLVDEEALQRAIKALELPGNAVVSYVSTTKTGQYPIAKLDPIAYNSGFVVVTDVHGVDQSLPESYVLLNIANSADLFANMEFVVYNSTNLKMRVTGGSKVRVAFTREESFIAPYGLGRFKLVNLATQDALPRWLVGGDVGYASGGDGTGVSTEIDDILKAVTAAITQSIADIENGERLG